MFVFAAWNSKYSFNNVKYVYQNSLNSANYNHRLLYDNSLVRENNKWNQNILYFNQYFNLSVATKVGNEFINLFRNHQYLTILNYNTIKIPYSCTSSFKNDIIDHNNNINKILNNTNNKIKIMCATAKELVI